MATGTEPRIQPVPLEDWQKMMWSIYGPKDRRDYTLEELLLHVVGQAGKIAKGLRKDSVQTVREVLPEMFVWLLGFCSMYPLDLEKIVWEKYPGLCPYCGTDKNCMCIVNEHKPATWYENPGGEKPVSLDGWQEMFHQIYGRVNKIALFIAVGLHLQEEVGEAAEAFVLRNLPQGSEELRHELADVFVWIMALCNRLDVRLSEITWERYPGVCDVCRKSQCACHKV